MIRQALVLAGKDLRLTLTRGNAPAQAVLLGLLLIVLFSLSLDGQARAGATAAAALFWLASAFCQTLIFNALFSLEENSGTRLGLLLAPMPVQSVWLGKALAGFCLLLLIQLALLAASIIFLGQAFSAQWPLVLPAVLLIDAGIAAAGALLGALAQSRATRESLCSIVVFPLLIPLFLAGIRILALLFNVEDAAHARQDALQWAGLAAAFDAIFIAAALVLFPFVYGGDR